MSIEDWNNLCNKKQRCDEKSAIEELKAKDIAQWENTCYKSKDNFEKSVAEDLRKNYSANHWKVIRELFQILGFIGIDDKHILSSNISHAKVTSDLNLAIRAINAIVENWCGYTIKINRKKVGPKEQ
ncbi:3917_t:CDS:2 [Cetraspora pellucida]|uniref:3917_t:CDS:1 n=1 Tax=Cetraspora pellucida TaxID=1433469 RepID=A0ACA9K3C1_9GLOM|nr:3917_t:CDS:2 [Cetraspora pellucida]